MRDFRLRIWRICRKNLEPEIKRCQDTPVILCVGQQPKAALVSLKFLADALEALYGFREVITPVTMTEEQRDDLANSWPSVEEITAGRWDDEADTAAELKRRSELKLPFKR